MYPNREQKLYFAKTFGCIQIENKSYILQKLLDALDLYIIRC
ncbi:hypothetical protein DZC34_12695 [Clostridium botulinum]|nr:hypothetical protein DZC34_12695 [Clostridium botulinum]